MSYKYSEHDI